MSYIVIRNTSGCLALSSCTAHTCTEELMDISVTIFIKIIPEVPTILDSTLASAWFGDRLKDRTAECTNNTS
jgi:hypothetical protein